MGKRNNPQLEFLCYWLLGLTSAIFECIGGLILGLFALLVDYPYQHGRQIIYQRVEAQRREKDGK